MRSALKANEQGHPAPLSGVSIRARTVSENTLYYGDNLDILRAVEDEIMLGQR